MQRYDAINTVLGNRLRQIRKSRGINQSEIGQTMGVTFQAYQKVEQGKSCLRVGALLAIMKRLGIGFDQLFDEIGPREASVLPEDQQTLLDAYLKLPDGQRKSVLNVVVGLSAHKRGNRHEKQSA